MTELATPAEFDAAADPLTEEAVAAKMVCGSGSKQLAEFQSFKDAVFDHVYVRQVGPAPEGFFRFYEREIIPRLR